MGTKLSIVAAALAVVVAVCSSDSNPDENPGGAFCCEERA